MSGTAWRIRLPDEAATETLGEALAQAVPVGLVALEGELGTGKTTLVRAWLRALGHRGTVPSPTYTLVEAYESLTARAVYHFDLYRLGAPEELDFIGIEDYLDPAALCLVEWPEQGEGVLPAPTLRLRLTRSEGAHEARIEAGEAADGVASALAALAPGIDVRLE